MNDGALFTDLQTKPRMPQRRRNSPVKASLAAQGVVGNIPPDSRGAVAQQLTTLLAALGIDRGDLAEKIGLSRSSTSHWHHGSNGISRHNLAVLLDMAKSKAPAAAEALADLWDSRSVWAEYVCPGLRYDRQDPNDEVLEQPVGLARAIAVTVSANDDVDTRVAAHMASKFNDAALTWVHDGIGYQAGPFSIICDHDRWRLHAVLATGLEIDVETARLSDAIGAAHDIWSRK